MPLQSVGPVTSEHLLGRRVRLTDGSGQQEATVMGVALGINSAGGVDLVLVACRDDGALFPYSYHPGITLLPEAQGPKSALDLHRSWKFGDPLPEVPDRPRGALGDPPLAGT